MPTLERALDSLATRGKARGADVLIERLELELSYPGAELLQQTVHAEDRGPLGWRKGLAIALATSFVVLVVFAVSFVAAELFGGPSPDVATPPVTTQAPPAELPAIEIFDGVVLTGTEMIGIVEDGLLVPLVTDECCVGTAVSDLVGGVVFQRDENAVVWAAAADSGTEIPVALVEAGAAERVSLEGVADIGGEPTVVFVRFLPTGDGDERATLATVGLVSGSRTDVVVLGEGGVVVDRVSYARGMYLVSVGDSDGTWFEFRDEGGAVVAVASNPRPAPAGSLVGQGVLTEDGEMMVFIERQAADVGGGLADLVTFDLDRGVELSRHHIADFGDRIVAFDGNRVVVARQRANPELPPIMMAFHLSAEAVLIEGGLGSFSP